MRACGTLLFASVLVTATGCLTVLQGGTTEPHSDIQIPLKPLFITCSLSEIIVVSAPLYDNARYFLTKPNGDTMRLNITRPTYKIDPTRFYNTEDDIIAVKYENYHKSIMPVKNYRVIDLRADEFGDFLSFNYFEAKHVDDNDFMIGPLLQEDHGNWILSVYYTDHLMKMIEVYQVITLEIEDYVPPKRTSTTLSPGDTFKFSFAYPIPNLESCELRAPKTSFDRFYERDLAVDMASCGYVIKNVSEEERGLWSITGVGLIVYRTQIYLNVQDKSKTTTRLFLNDTKTTLQ